MTALVVALAAGFTGIDTLATLVNIGALFAFVLVAIAVLLLRRLDPGRPRRFRTPLVPVLPIVSIAGSIWLMTTLDGATWARFLVWMAIGLVVYALYSSRRSRIRHGAPGPPPAAAPE